MSENRLDFLTLSTDAKNYQERLTHDEFHRIVAQRSAKQKMKTIHLRYTQIGSVKTVCQIFIFFRRERRYFPMEKDLQSTSYEKGVHGCM